MKTYDRVKSHYPNGSCPTLKHATDSIMKMFNWLESKNLLSEEGYDEIQNIGISSSLTDNMVTNEGKELLDKFYHKWLNLREGYTVPQNEYNSFWDNRYNDMKLIKNMKIANESSFVINKVFDNRYIDTESYLESLDVNMPKGTKSLLFESTYEKGYLKLVAIPMDKYHSTIVNNEFDSLSYNPKFSYIHIDRSCKLEDVKLKIVDSLESLSECWNSKERLTKCPIRCRFSELDIITKIQ